MDTKLSPEGEDRTQKRHCELLERLESIILREGFSGLTVGGIASRLRCSRRSIYELAPSKDELVLRVIGDFFVELRRAGVEASPPTLDPDERVFQYLRPAIAAAQRMSTALVNDIDAWEPSQALWQAHLRERVDGLRRIVEDGIRAGAFRGVHAHLVAETVFASVNRLREPDFYTVTNMTIAEAFQEYYAMLIAALRQPENATAA